MSVSEVLDEVNSILSQAWQETVKITSKTYSASILEGSQGSGAVRDVDGCWEEVRPGQPPNFSGAVSHPRRVKYGDLVLRFAYSNCKHAVLKPNQSTRNLVGLDDVDVLADAVRNIRCLAKRHVKLAGLTPRLCELKCGF
jgi:hypothetical protein